MVNIVSLVASYVRGAAQIAIDAARIAEQTGVTDADWWQAREPVLDEYFDPAQYPTLSSLGMDGTFDPTGADFEYHLQLALESFEFGLQRMLDGIAVFIRERAVDPTFGTNL
jgi:hypothetical protein